MSESRSELIESHEAARCIASLERLADANNRKLWFAYRSGMLRHNQSFYGLFGQDDFSDWLGQEIEKRNGEISVLEAMGNGALLREIPELKRGVFNELQEWRKPEEVDYDQSHGIIPVYGDITALATTRKIYGYLRRQGMAGFDLVVCRPAAGVAGFKITFKMQRFIIDRLCSFVAPGGALVINMVPPEREVGKIENWVDRLGQTAGLEVRTNLIGSLFIQKHKDAPIRLPNLVE